MLLLHNGSALDPAAALEDVKVSHHKQSHASEKSTAPSGSDMASLKLEAAEYVHSGTVAVFWRNAFNSRPASKGSAAREQQGAKGVSLHEIVHARVQFHP